MLNRDILKRQRLPQLTPVVRPSPGITPPVPGLRSDKMKITIGQGTNLSIIVLLLFQPTNVKPTMIGPSTVKMTFATA